MRHLNNILLVLLIILILFIITALFYEYKCTDPRGNLIYVNGNGISSGPLNVKTTRANQKASTKRLLYATGEGMIRGVLLGSLTGGIVGATSYAIALGVLNPFMIVFLDVLPPGALFKP
jgi:hypothetical protein